MEGRCPRCSACYFPCEKTSSEFWMCCRGGKLNGIPVLPPAPEPFAKLLKGTGARARAFKDDVRRYNAALAFGSFNDARGNGAFERDGGWSRRPPVYAMHGQTYHSIFTFYPSNERQPRVGKMCICDSEEAARLRVGAFEGLDESIVRSLHEMLVNPMPRDGTRTTPKPRNPYPSQFKHLHERVRAEEAKAREQGEEPRQLVLRMTCANLPDPRKYNKPTARDSLWCMFVTDRPRHISFKSTHGRRSQLLAERPRARSKHCRA